MWHVWDEVHTGFWWENKNEEDNVDDLDVEGRVYVECDLKLKLWR
jgi:hypothetical protein